jgi:hypothetical protein
MIQSQIERWPIISDLSLASGSANISLTKQFNIEFSQISALYKQRLYSFIRFEFQMFELVKAIVRGRIRIQLYDDAIECRHN